MMIRTATLAALVAGLTITTANAASQHYPLTASIDNKPTTTEANIVRSVLEQSFGTEWSSFVKSSGHVPTFTVGHADLDGDGRPDLLVLLNDSDFGYCGSAGCAGYAILATPQGYAAKPIDLATFYEKVTVLPAIHKGMHDLRYDDAHKVFVWDGMQYR